MTPILSSWPLERFQLQNVCPRAPWQPSNDQPSPDEKLSAKISFTAAGGGVLGGLIAIVDLPGAEHVPGGGLRIWRGEIAVDQMDPGLLSDDPVNRQAEQRLERPHGVIGVRAEDAVDDDMGAVTAAVDLTLNGAHGVTVTSLLHLDDQLGPGLRPDDPVDAQPPMREMFAGLSNRRNLCPKLDTFPTLSGDGPRCKARTIARRVRVPC